MSKAVPKPDRPGRRKQSRPEEVANSLSHSIGLFAGIAFAPMLVTDAARRGGTIAIIGAGVFISTVIVLYFSSVVYHALRPGRPKEVFQVLDHVAIFLLIAGTYTPFTLGVLRGPWGWSVLAVVWGIALVGVVFKALVGVRHEKFSLSLYLAMGWSIVIAAKPLWLLMPREGLLWIAAGGLAYTAGVPFYATDERLYRHLVWHLFVLAGTACHFVAVLRFAG